MTTPILEIEADCLGACLIDPVAADRVVEILLPGDFLDPKHRAIFAVLAHRTRMREPVDPATIATALNGAVLVSDVLGLTLRVTTGVYARHHATTVLAASKNRTLATLCAEYQATAQRAAADPQTSNDLVNGLRSALDELSWRGGTSEPKKLSDAEPGLLGALEAKEPMPSGIPTGFLDLDSKLGGMQNGDMIVLAARPSIGKSLFAANVAQNVTFAHDPKTALVFSLEMSDRAVYRRFLFSQAGVKSRTALNGHASPSDIARLKQAKRELDQAPWYIHDRAGMRMMDVHAISRRFQNKHGKGLIIIDYLQIMRGEGHNRYEMVTNLSNDCKRLAKDLDCPVMVLSQLNRRTEYSDDLPGLADLRESGAIEQDADVAIFLHRDKDNRDPHPCHVIVDKNREGACGVEELLFDTQAVRFRNKVKPIKPAEPFPGGSKK